MKSSDIKPGATYWTTRPDTEAEGYGDNDPRLPYQVQVMDDGKYSNYRCCLVDDHGEPDEDPNATAYCRPQDLHATREEAAEAYKAQAQVRISRAESTIQFFRDRIAELK